MLKKLTLLAMAVGALVVFAIPAVASADQWYTTANPTDILIGNKANDDTIELTGNLTGTTAVGEIGPCMVHVKMTVWNEGGAAKAEVLAGGTITSPCPANILGTACEVETVIIIGLPAVVDITATTVNVTNVGIKWILRNCPIKEVSVTGNLTGTVNNATNCIDMSGGDLSSTLVGAVTVDSSLCDATHKLTLK